MKAAQRTDCQHDVSSYYGYYVTVTSHKLAVKKEVRYEGSRQMSFQQAAALKGITSKS